MQYCCYRFIILRLLIEFTQGEQMFYSNNALIELRLSKNIIRLTNYRKEEKGRVYSFNARRLYQVMKTGGSKQIVPTYGEEKCVEISFSLKYHPAGKHISSAKNKINTYIDDITYNNMMKIIEEEFIDDQII